MTKKTWNSDLSLSFITIYMIFNRLGVAGAVGRVYPDL